MKKTTIPNLLPYSDPVVVLDIKREDFDISSGFRAQCGQEIDKLELYNGQAENLRLLRGAE